MDKDEQEEIHAEITEVTFCWLKKDKYFLQCHLINTFFSTWLTYHIQHIHIVDNIINSNCIWTLCIHRISLCHITDE